MSKQAEEIIDSIGIEFEFSDVNRELREFRHELANRAPGFAITHDASCETPKQILGNIPINFETEKARKLLGPYCRDAVVGGEITSPICNARTVDWIQSIYNLCDIMREFGETESSTRDSLHIHINVTREIPLFVLRNLLRLTGSFEAILFRLGGMGRMNRGNENDFIYERPFLGNGPPVVWDFDTKTGKPELYPCFDFNDLMSADTKTDFFDRYGGARSLASGGARYVSCRYTAVNFYPVLTLGSFEFRTANKTLNSSYIIAWANFCRAFVEKAFSSRNESLFDPIQRPLYENRDISENEFKSALMYLDSLDETSRNILVEVWKRSPVPTFDNIWRFSHLVQPTRFGNIAYRPQHLNYDVVQRAKFVDIHQLQGDARRFDPREIPENLGEFGRRFVAAQQAGHINVDQNARFVGMPGIIRNNDERPFQRNRVVDPADHLVFEGIFNTVAPRNIAYHFDYVLHMDEFLANSTLIIRLPTQEEHIEENIPINEGWVKLVANLLDPEFDAISVTWFMRLIETNRENLYVSACTRLVDERNRLVREQDEEEFIEDDNDVDDAPERPLDIDNVADFINNLGNGGDER